ncbi:hypothetical protein I7X12_13990 [Halosimplex litoreum]|uniref:Uncharacterized protein n=1 Tax=Halosimplex litoreum TaxID=1198301 RepID=A0A7T3FWB8_9EURY|nr:hypothetical protein [Halosimplex litoreum]QPV61856.1 hypothetical protein I7X12_13990 [Halosimplex litoreum]
MSDRRHLALGAVTGGFLVVGLGLRWLGEGVGTLWLAQWGLLSVGGFAAYASERVRVAGARVANARPVQATILTLSLGVTGYCWFVVYLTVTGRDLDPGSVFGVAFYGTLGTFGLWIAVATGRGLLSGRAD